MQIPAFFSSAHDEGNSIGWRILAVLGDGVRGPRPVCDNGEIELGIEEAGK